MATASVLQGGTEGEISEELHLGATVTHEPFIYDISPLLQLCLVG